MFTLYEHNRINCFKGLGIYLYITLLLPLFEECKCNYGACTCVVHITDEMTECKSLSRKWSMKLTPIHAHVCMQENIVCVYCSSPHAELIDFVISCPAVIRYMYLNEHVHQEVTADYVQVCSV